MPIKDRVAVWLARHMPMRVTFYVVERCTAMTAKDLGMPLGIWSDLTKIPACMLLATAHRRMRGNPRCVIWQGD